jgi:hypothetical protein
LRCPCSSVEASFRSHAELVTGDAEDLAPPSKKCHKPTSGPLVKAWCPKFDRTMRGSIETGSPGARRRSKLDPSQSRRLRRPSAQSSGPY